MSRVYDSWERVVEATLKREELRQVALCRSFSSSFSTELSFDSAHQDASALSTPNNLFYQDVRSIAFEELKKATGNFQLGFCLGEGAFSVIYKGWIHESTFTASKGFMRSLSLSGMAVAIKKWRSQTKLDLVAWLAELRYLSQLHHANIVKLVGYCSERENMVLVYEYSPKGSLNHQLFRTKDGPVADVSRDSTRVVGTSDLLAPEYVMTGRLTTKCDVFAFGVVLLEILSGCRAINLIAAIEEDGPVDWVKIYMDDKAKMLGIMDTKLKGQYTPNEAHTAVNLGLQCLNSNPELRPRMAEVLAALQQLSGLKNDQ